MNENKPGFVRCVHPKREGADWFPEDMANSKSWQRSTGWYPQPLPQSHKKEKVEPKSETAHSIPPSTYSAPVLSGVAESKPGAATVKDKKPLKAKAEKKAPAEAKKKLITADSI